jgi:hypothetical protein
MAYTAQSKTGSAERPASAGVKKLRPASSYGMKDRKSGRKKGVNCSTGRYATK